ncbi:MAG: response regulator transcription factor [Solirubrobacteraceae bacterium]
MSHATQTILVVDQEQGSRTYLADNLTADGYEVLEAGTLASAQRLICTRLLDLAIIDPRLPDGDGLELLGLVRQAAPGPARIDADLPLIVTSGRSSSVDRVRGFERGCDDYLSSPYDYPELRARVVALLRRRARSRSSARLRVGPLELDTLARQAWVDGEPVQLSTKEFGLLRALAAEPERAFSRTELLRSVWGWADAESAVRTRTLDSHASRLRHKLARHGPQFVINVWGVGYRLIDATPGPSLSGARGGLGSL